MLGAPPRRDDLEFLDNPERHRLTLPANLADIRRLNRWFGGKASVIRRLGPILRERPAASLLDVATGSADVPLALLAWSRQHGTRLTITGLDVSADVLEEARQFTHDQQVTLVEGDALALSFPDDSFDVVTCCLAIHHFDPDRAVQVLREMWRVTSDVVLIADLRRSYLGWFGAGLLTRTFARNELTKHDGPLSVLRAYTPVELQTLAATAGWRSPNWQAFRPARQTLLARKWPPRG